MRKADGLSRRLDQKVGVEKDNKKQMLVKKEQLETKRIRVTEVMIKGVDLINKVRKYEARDNKMVKAMEEIKQTGMKIFKDEQW